MPSKKPTLRTYTTQEIVEKFNLIAELENRTMSKHLEYLVKKHIEEYENQNGKIEIKQINIDSVNHSGSGDINIK